MIDTAFAVPSGKRARFGNFYVANGEGNLQVNDAPDGNWSAMPNFPSGAGGLVSTVDDLYAFGRMLNGGGALDGRRVLSPDRCADNHRLPDSGTARGQPACSWRDKGGASADRLMWR